MTINVTLKDCPLIDNVWREKMRGWILRDFSKFTREELEKLLGDVVKWFSNFEFDLGHTLGELLASIYRMKQKGNNSSPEYQETVTLARFVCELRGVKFEELVY